jgi:hypothetical protein
LLVSNYKNVEISDSDLVAQLSVCLEGQAL